MSRIKKAFMPPRVNRTEEIRLETDLLLGPSAEMQVLAAGQNYFEWDMDVEGVYTSDDWTLSD